MDLVKTLYIEINIIGIVILLIMLICTMGIYYDFDKGCKKIFVRLTICNIIVLSADIISHLFQGRVEPIYFTLVHLILIIYFTMHPCIGLLWLQLILKKLKYDHIDKTLSNLMYLPLVVCIALILSSPWTNLVYELTDENIYVRGAYLVTITILSFSYIIIGELFVIIGLLSKEQIIGKNDYITLLVFPIPTVIGCALQMKFFGVTLIWVCTAISFLILFINLQSYHITKDFLTGLYNRMQTEKLIERELSLLQKADYNLYIGMIDIDHFKSINDNFGHAAGDKALVASSKILKESCRDKDVIGRYGGDEFIILGRIDNKKEINDIINNINKNVKLYNSDNPVHKITFSIGYDVYVGGEKLMLDSILQSADKKMYENKNKSRLNGISVFV